MAGLDVVEDVGEEDYLKLVEVEGLGDVQQQLVGVQLGVVLRHLVQYLIRLVGQSAPHELPI